MALLRRLEAVKTNNTVEGTFASCLFANMRNAVGEETFGMRREVGGCVASTTTPTPGKSSLNRERLLDE